MSILDRYFIPLRTMGLGNWCPVVVASVPIQFGVYLSIFGKFVTHFIKRWSFLPIGNWWICSPCVWDTLIVWEHFENKCPGVVYLSTWHIISAQYVAGVEHFACRAEFRVGHIVVIHSYIFYLGLVDGVRRYLESGARSVLELLKKKDSRFPPVSDTAMPFSNKL